MKKKLSILIALVMAISLCLSPTVALAADTYQTAASMSIPAEITVDVTEDSVIWNIDIDIAACLPPGGSINDKVNYALIISLDKVNPAFQIHSNDGVDADFDWGTHLYSEYVGGWLTGGETANNILVSSLDWVEATGGYKLVDNPGGIFTITIDKAELGLEFYWAVAIMGRTCDTHYPEAWAMWSGDASTFEMVTIPGAATTAETEVLGDLIQISITPTLLNFGPVYPGHSSAEVPLAVQNTGSVPVVVSASTDSTFYQENLTLDSGLLAGWSATIEDGTGVIVITQVKVPSGYPAGMQSGTIIFWAEAK